jgi:hypothetical protein
MLNNIYIYINQTDETLIISEKEKEKTTTITTFPKGNKLGKFTHQVKPIITHSPAILPFPLYFSKMIKPLKDASSHYIKTHNYTCCT